MKKLLALLLAVCVVIGCAGVTGEDIPAYGVISVTQTQAMSTRYPGMEEPEITHDGHRIVYGENGLAETYAEWTDKKAQVLSFAVEDGELKMTDDPEEIGQQMLEAMEDAIGTWDLAGEYELNYEFDEQGNPCSLKMIQKNGTRHYAFLLNNHYEDGRLVSVTAEPPLPIPNHAILPMYELLGHFTGYADAAVDFGSVMFRNEHGRMVLSRQAYGFSMQMTVENTYADGQLIRTVQTQETGGVPDSTIETSYDRAGRVVGMAQTMDDTVFAAEVIYENRTDKDGAQYSYGTFVFPDGTEAPEGFDGAVICRMYPSGRVAEIGSTRLLAPDDGTLVIYGSAVASSRQIYLVWQLTLDTKLDLLGMDVRDCSYHRDYSPGLTVYQDHSCWIDLRAFDSSGAPDVLVPYGDLQVCTDHTLKYE